METVNGLSKIEAVKGLQGRWHLTNGDWDETGNELRTLCGTSVSPNFRRLTEKDAKKTNQCRECKLKVM